MTISKPHHIEAVAELLISAVETEQPLYLSGRGTKSAYHEPAVSAHHLSMSDYSGIITYEPEELVIDIKSGTPLEEVEAALADKNQMLAFEPPDMRHILKTDTKGTIGGVMAANLSGPRRISAGAARDYLLGFEAVSGRSGLFKSGSRVMKNVTGYDLSKLMCGSFGTLAVMTDITLKVLPRPETEATIMVTSSSVKQAQQILASAFMMATEPSGGAIIADDNGVHAYIRLEGVGVSVNDRAQAMSSALESLGSLQLISADSSQQLWSDIGSLKCFTQSGYSVEQGLWKVSLTPDRLPDFIDGLNAQKSGAGSSGVLFFADWAGGLVWLAGLNAEQAGTVRSVLSEVGGGHAHYLSSENEGVIQPFQPQTGAHLALSRRIKEAFDPLHILNRGVMGLSDDMYSDSDKAPR